MPSRSDHHLSDYHLGPDPRSDPTCYPGDRLSFDYLLQGDRVLPLHAGADGWPTGRGERSPVVAFGSNAAPAQLAAKFGRSTAGRAAIAVTRARLHGFSLAHSPHVSIPGYVPWVLVDAPGAMVDCAVLWLDGPQRARLDVTEPNYDLVPVDAVRYPLVVEALDTPIEAMIGYAAYRGRWGALCWPGEPGPAPAGTQSELFDRLGALGWFRDLVGEGPLTARQARLARDPALRHRVRDELTACGMVASDGWRAD
ncbi:MAG TPA: hypothetical protein VIC62_15300 [Nakamurella sp.]|jgi:hypothetical protein